MAPERTAHRIALACVLCWGCGSDPRAPSASPEDAAIRTDAAESADDAGASNTTADAEASAADAGEMDLADAGSDAAPDDAGQPPTEDVANLPYARHVVSFTPGTQAGFGAAKFPDVVLGPPKGGGTGSGSLDVLSLGVGGEIVLDFGDKTIVDGTGPDFLVFENAFWSTGDASSVFAEPAQVSVSGDGETWLDFPCNPTSTGPDRYQGCAGVAPTLEYDAFAVLPLDPAKTGGDAFDLADVGIESARFVKIHDQATSGAGTSAGFDLDAVGLIHFTTAAR